MQLIGDPLANKSAAIMLGAYLGGAYLTIWFMIIGAYILSSAKIVNNNVSKCDLFGEEIAVGSCTLQYTYEDAQSKATFIATVGRWSNIAAVVLGFTGTSYDANKTSKLVFARGAIYAIIMLFYFGYLSQIGDALNSGSNEAQQGGTVEIIINFFPPGVKGRGIKKRRNEVQRF